MATIRPFRARTVLLLLASYICICLAVQDPKDRPKDPKVDTPPVSQIFANGSFVEPWRDASVGCKQCNFKDVAAARSGSTASASVQIQPWGVLTIASTQRAVADSVLDFWAKGSGLTALSLYTKDSATKTLSRDVRFQRANQVQDGVTILGNDDDGFIHIQVALNALRATDNSTHDGCGTGVSQHFDRIVFADISGMGFTLVLDDFKLISPNVMKASDFFLPTLSTLPPVFGDDLLSLKSARNRYTIKLKPNVTHDAISMICQELGGAALHPRRFSGMCNTPLKLLRSNTGMKLSWDLVTLTVQSPDDLKAMRAALKDHIEWFEADLIGFTTVRALHEAANGAGNKLNINFQKVEEDARRTRMTLQTSDRFAQNPEEVFRDNQAEEQDPAQKPMSLEARDAIADSAGLQSVSSWGLDRINQVDLPLDNTYSSGDFDGRGVHVYVLDTGLRPTHFEFRGRVGAGASAVGGSVDDDQGHGTHCSGTAVGSVHGVAPGATLHPVKVMDAKGNGAFSNIIAGIQWAKDHKVKNNYASAVISMSIAGPRSAALNDAVEAAVAAGMTVVAAAGNNRGGDSCTMSPSSAPSSITVGASTDTDAMASMSNIGTCLSLFAPGAYIASAGFKSDTDEVYMSGTSMAAPHVAGAAALYLQYRPGAPAAEVRAALMKAAVGRYFETSSPKLLLNVMSSRLRAAQEAVAPTPKPAPKPSPSPKPVPKPSPSPAPKPAAQPVPSPSPKPVVKPSPSPAPKPAAPAPTPTSLFKPITFGNLLKMRASDSETTLDEVRSNSEAPRTNTPVDCCEANTCRGFIGCHP